MLRSFAEKLIDIDDIIILHQMPVKGSSGNIYKGILKNKTDENGEPFEIVFKEIYEHYFSPKYFFRELDIMKRIKHPCTVGLDGFNIVFKKDKERTKFDKYKTSIATPFYQNQSLYLCLTQPRNPEMYYDNWTGTEKTKFIYGVGRAVRWMHENKIIHRDLKPHNIFVDKHKRPHVADFGLSRSRLNENVNNSIDCGTAKYKAPEMLNNKNYSFPADIFSLGLVFYELCEGKSFEQGFSISNHTLCSYKLLSQVFATQYKSGYRPEFLVTSRKMKVLIKWMWDGNPQYRPTIDVVCERLEDPDCWFDDTDEKEFLKFKEEIDEYEKKARKQCQINLKSASKEKNEVNECIEQNKDNPFKLVRDMINLAVSTNSEALFVLGTWLYHGYILPRDWALSLKCLTVAVYYGNIYAKPFIEKIENDAKNFGETAEGYLLRASICELTNDSIGLIRQYLAAAKSGSIPALGKLGSILYNNVVAAENIIKQSNGNKNTHTKMTINKTSDEIANEKMLALSYLEKGAKENDVFACYMLAKIKYENRKYDEAIPYLEICLRKKYFDAPYLLGCTYQSKGDIEKALEYYKLGKRGI
ncbi:hypothetical protein TRFO_22230 [Tritrichomonas foetus]|uniref:Protein kinase domain-containing protein n=1 Tax=Tritrichomonas foetus TaxID=1144522 RepID=A0A1J4KDD5_9EUKA|nr:hypothetical protein TRFO_22230 [Tritrichomonas foetus]|eukprot:OHT08994.1 hypothetical protein TRFO_22230 [Tritrichomonas foetus]